MPESPNEAREAMRAILRKISGHSPDETIIVAEMILTLLWECGYKIVRLEKKDMQ